MQQLIMGSFSMSMLLFSLLSCAQILVATNSSLSPTSSTLCHSYESTALLQFKQSFSFEMVASNPLAHPKVASWKPGVGESGDCCSWEGVECDEETGHVIGLDLRDSSLYGSINSSSSLFRLVHLRSLNLADNNFNYSQIPSAISQLSNLSFLNLSFSFFSGQIPFELLAMSKLTVLDMAENVDTNYPFGGLLKLEKPSFSSLVQNMTNLEELYLNKVHINSTVPEIVVNMTSLRALSLGDCGLHGEFPGKIFQMPKLEILKMWYNQNLTAQLPKFHPGRRLKILEFSYTSLSGKIPDSIGELSSLTELSLSHCNLVGSVPASISNLTQLTSLKLDANSFSRWELPSLSKLTKLTQLDLTDSNLHGEFPSSLVNLTQLTVIFFSSNHLTGQIPTWIMNFTQLSFISLSLNQMHGPIPSSFSELKNLQFISLHSNYFTGPVEAKTFLGLQKLTQLILMRNNLSLILDANATANLTLPKFTLLALGSCNLKEIPSFLMYQDELEVLSLERNMIHGRIPDWLWQGSTEVASGSDQHKIGLPWAGLLILDLSYNLLEGSVSAPPPNAFYYSLSNNKLTGEIPPLLCRTNSLAVLDLSNNAIRGRIPPCLSNLSNTLSILNLKGNKLQGTVPPLCSKQSNLRMMDLSQNQLEGKLPRSLSNCKVLQTLILGDNQIEDTFPFWLGSLSEFQVLILRSNKFHGEVAESPLTSSTEFPKLRIIDLSNNGFTGELPQKYFQKWHMMMMTGNVNWPEYLQTSISFQLQITWTGIYAYSMSMNNKGVKTQYEKILDIFTAIDLSSNNFRGEIPESVGMLKGLQLLNLSNNHLTGIIPPNIGSLTQLESLDLSGNDLSGEIPQGLAQLTFLAFLNVSYNHLTGALPHGKQFETFENISYVGNSGLCGDPLSRRCEKTEPLKPSPHAIVDEDDDFQFPGEIGWIVISLGFGSGLLVGFIFGQHLTTRYHEWFVEKFGRMQKNGKRRRRS